MYDFAKDITKICDIDFYRATPTVNDMGEVFWGAKRTKSPEEFILGAKIDSKTNVFTMGAIAFGLLGGETDHSFSKWDASRTLYEVALRAVRLFTSETVDALLAEHVWEHLTYEEGIVAAEYCYQFLKPGGYLRCAVPDKNFRTNGTNKWFKTVVQDQLTILRQVTK